MKQIVKQLTDDRLVDIEIAKERCHKVIDSINSYPSVDNAGFIARATTNTIKQLLVNAGVTTEVNFYNTFTENLIVKEEQICDMLDMDLPDVETED